MTIFICLGIDWQKNDGRNTKRVKDNTAAIAAQTSALGFKAPMETGTKRMSQPTNVAMAGSSLAA